MSFWQRLKISLKDFVKFSGVDIRNSRYVVRKFPPMLLLSPLLVLATFIPNISADSVPQNTGANAQTTCMKNRTKKYFTNT